MQLGYSNGGKIQPQSKRCRDPTRVKVYVGYLALERVMHLSQFLNRHFIRFFSKMFDNENLQVKGKGPICLHIILRSRN